MFLGDPRNNFQLGELFLQDRESRCEVVRMGGPSGKEETGLRIPVQMFSESRSLVVVQDHLDKIRQRLPKGIANR